MLLVEPKTAVLVEPFERRQMVMLHLVTRANRAMKARMLTSLVPRKIYRLDSDHALPSVFLCLFLPSIAQVPRLIWVVFS